MSLKSVNEMTFQAEVLQSSKPVLVDFWAAWCGPCRIIAPTLEAIAAERSDVEIVQLNVDDSPNVARIYQVASIPTFILFKNGEVADRIMGALPKSKLESFIDRNL